MSVMDIMSILASPITEAGKWLFGALKREVSYLTNYNENIENLHNHANDLRAKTYDVQNRLNEAERNLEEPEKAVLEWLKKTDNIQVAAASIDQRARDEKRCLRGICPNLTSRRRLSKQAVKNLNVIRELKEDERNFRRISHIPPPPSVVNEQTDGVENFKSRALIMNQVMDSLHDKNIRSIGVYGMAGIGKTTLMKNVNNKLHGSNLFKKIIMVTVSQNPDVKQIHYNIAHRLGLKFDPDDTEIIRAEKLRTRLEKEKPVLLILDDLWGKLDMRKTGIPCEGNQMVCKVIITTREVDVCTQMNVETVLEMHLLPYDEACALFKEKAGNVVTLQHLQSVAEKIVRRCKGSPLAIVTLGSSLKGNESIHSWRQALNILEHPYPSGLQYIMPEVTASLRYSYNHLPGREIQLCFLFCCLFPEDWDIECSDMRNYGIGEGFLNVNGGLQVASDDLFSYIQKLKNCCLLLDGDKEGYVKLHDVVRDVGLSIASDDENGFLVNIETGFMKWSEIEKLKGFRRVSFMKYENIKLFVPSECPQLPLRSLLIRENRYTTIDQDNFFETMKALVVLDMRSELQIFSRNLISMPGSVACLTNLWMLSLVRCDISSRVAVLGEMMNLEILCLRDSKIDKLPEEIGNLRNLKCLDLTRAEFSLVAPHIMSKLTNLEELHAWADFDEWNNELKCLVRLSSLEVRLRDDKFQGISFPWENLKHFCLAIIDYSNLDLYSIREKNNLYLGKANPISHWVNKSLSKLTHKLFLDSCHGFNNIAELYTKGGFKYLERLDLKSCDEIEYLINVEEDSKNALQDAFHDLKDLRISDLKNLKNLYHGLALDHRFLGQLENLKLYRCPNLINVLSSNLLLPAQRLDKLESLYVLECKALLEVFNTEPDREGSGLVEPSEGSGACFTSTAMLSGLRRFDLLDVPELTSIWKGPIPTGSLGNLQILEVLGCDRVKHLFSSSLAEGLRHLEWLNVTECFEMETLVLSNSMRKEEATSSTRLSQMGPFSSEKLPPTVTTFPNLMVLGVSECNKLKKLLPFNLAQGLRNLKELGIYSCSDLEEIIEKDDEEEETVDGLLPQLQSLTLKFLPSLRSIYYKDLALACPLKKVEVHKCPNFKSNPLGQECTSTLVEVEADREWFEGLEWEDESLRSRFHPFFRPL